MFLRPAEMFNLCRFALVFAAIASFCFPVAAAPNYFTRIWQVEQGLPQNKVTAVVQTRDGYLWVGTYNGLARFDGVRFTVFDEKNTRELHSRRITSLFEATDGTIWIGTESGDVSQYKDGHFSSVPLRGNWGDGKIYAITADDAGDVWLMNGAGELARARDGKVLSPPSGTVTNVVSLTRGRDGTVWVNREGRVSLLKQGQLLPVELSEPGSKTYLTFIQGIAASRDGGLWVTSSGNIRKWKNGQWVAGQSVAGQRVADLDAAPWGYSPVANFLETSSGVLMGGTSVNGLWMVFPDSTNTPAVHFSRTNGLPSDWVISLWEDREKNLWCGTGAGLVVIRPNNLETISPPDKWNGCAVLSVLPMPDGTLWAGTEGAGLYRLQNGSWTSFGRTNSFSDQGIRNPFVWSLAADDAGKILAGTWGGGLFKQKNDAFDNAPGLENFLVPMPALLFVGDELWIGTPAGAQRYQNGQLKRFKEIDGKPFGDVRAIAQDKSGALWFGTAGGGLVHLQNGNFRRFKISDGLSSDFIECLHFADDGTLWIGTFGGGLNRLKDGQFSVIDQEQGLPNSVIGHIESDGRGYFWMSSYGGILRASEQDLNRCADGKLAEVPFLTYGINDGLPTLECSEGSQSAGGKTADGRLLFPTAKGLVVVDPEGAKINPLPPPVRIEAMRMDDKKFAGGYDAGSLKVPPGRHRIEFEYTSLSFVAPEKVRFKCRLNNFETEWADVGTKRVAIYNYIPPGKYSFQVIACNNDGVWNKTGASLKFEVLPYFWQTMWFRVFGGVATALGAGGVVWFDTRRRMRRRLERAERQRDIERERTRIARDIHDDLGAQLTRINLLSQTTQRSMDNKPQTTKNLDQICTTARQLTRAMDEIVWAVDPQHDTLDSLATYLGKLIHETLGDSGIRCRLDFPVHLPAQPVTAEARHNLFLAVKEALHNVLKHSGATEVQLAFAVEGAAFTMKVSDNGRGFDAAAPNDASLINGQLRPRRNGLANMRQRLREIGGRCEIHSEPGRGTQIVFSLPLTAAAK
ncbi:MAG: two-component regulator propeller domain-containing protein [Verrucomicrobiota bacterium]|jgi:signal transduction histidine kinase/ligand-binding sensor domain-containing protein